MGGYSTIKGCIIKHMRVELGPGIWYSEEMGYIIAEVPDLQPEPITVDGVLLNPKDEYHVSLVPARELANGDPEREAEIVRQVRAYLAHTAVKHGNLTGEMHICRELNKAGDIERTVIAGIQVVGLVALRSELGLPEAVPHVTVLKSANSLYGIGVNSITDLQQLCKRDDNLFRRVFPDVRL